MQQKSSSCGTSRSTIIDWSIYFDQSRVIKKMDDRTRTRKTDSVKPYNCPFDKITV